MTVLVRFSGNGIRGRRVHCVCLGCKRRPRSAGRVRISTANVNRRERHPERKKQTDYKKIYIYIRPEVHGETAEKRVRKIE